MIKRAYYKGLIKVAQGIPYNQAQHDLPQQWFTDRGYTQDQYNKYKNVGYSLNPVDRQQFIRNKIDMKRKAAQVPKTTTTRRQGNTVTTTTTGSGTFRQGKLVPPSGTQSGASVPTQVSKTPTAVSQLTRRKIDDMKRKAEQLRKAYKEKYGDAVPETISGTFRDGMVQLDDADHNAPPPVQPMQNIQPRKQLPAVKKQAPARWPARPRVRPQAPATIPNTQIQHRGYTWMPFTSGSEARKYYGRNVVGTKINGQTYYRPFNAGSSASTQNAARPGKRVVVPAYRQVM